MSTTAGSGRAGRLLKALVLVPCYLYLLGMLAWAGLYLLGVERWWWLFILNTIALWLFAPAPLLLVVALLMRRRALWAGLAGLALLWAALFGPLLLPRGLPDGTRPDLTVMSYNMLVFHEEIEPVMQVLRSAEVDVIALQELSPAHAEAISRELSASYPYQVLAPIGRNDVRGMGVISRYPLRQTGASFQAESWVGAPQVLEVELGEQDALLVNFHATASAHTLFAPFEQVMRKREQQARELAALAASQNRPLIVLGDLNVTERSAPYAIVREQLEDAWLEAGWGFGTTWPGTDHGPDATRSKVPHLLHVRIDYIFHSRHWQALSAEVASFDGGSDHRPVKAGLRLLR